MTCGAISFGVPDVGKEQHLGINHGAGRDTGTVSKRALCSGGGAVPHGRRSCPAERREAGASDFPPLVRSTAGFSSARAVILVTRASLARRLSLLWSSGRYLSGSASRPVSPCETGPVEFDGAFSPKPPSSLRKRAPPMRRGSTTQNKVRGLVASDAKRPDFNRKSADERQPPQRQYGARHNEKAPSLSR